MNIKNISLEEIERRVKIQVENENPAEILMKSKLDFCKIKYEYQYPIEAEKSWYILDFYLPKYNLAVEIDGKSHENKQKYDKLRDKYLLSKGIKTVRIFSWNVDFFNTNSLKSVPKLKKEKQKISISNKQKELNRLKSKEKELLDKKKKELVQKKLKEINDRKYPNLT